MRPEMTLQRRGEMMGGYNEEEEELNGGCMDRVGEGEIAVCEWEVVPT